MKMTSSENMPSIESWAFRSTLSDSWLSEAFARDADTLTKALQKSFSNNDNSVSDMFAAELIVPLMNQETSAVSSISGSDHQPLTKWQRSALPGPNTGKITKRKSRASKRTQTTFITADPANFRQMVQQVTGVRFGNTQVPMAPILKPEPQRPGSRLPGLGCVGGGCLPTLDTSAFLLDHQHQPPPPPSMVPSSGSVGSVIGPGQFEFQSSLLGDVHGVSAGLNLETLSSFPTLESWKVM